MEIKKRKGHRLSEETRRKISEAHKGKPSWNKGKILSEETKQKIREAHLGKKASKESRMKMSLARKGKLFTEEHKIKMGKARKIYLLNHPQVKMRLGLLNKGKHLSNEVKQKLGEKAKKRYENKENHPMYGKHQSEEHKRHLEEKIYSKIRNKTYEEVYGKEKAEEIKKKMSNSKKEWLKKNEISKETRMKISKGKIGKNNPAWKGGVKEVARTIRKMFESRLWIKYCMERDNYTCQKCKIIGGYLEVHHKKLLSQILKENNIKTVEDARKCLELWDLNNGITLCSNCHASSDKFRKRTLRRTK